MGILSSLRSLDAFSALCFFNDFQFVFMVTKIQKYGDPLTAYFAYVGIFFDALFHLGLEQNALLGNLSAFPFLFITVFPYRFIYKDKVAMAWYTGLTILTYYLGSFTGVPTDPLHHPARGDKGFVLAHGGNHCVTTLTYTLYVWWLMKNKHVFVDKKESK
jgi:hypothetical protein